MELGMVGLGKMGRAMTERLLKGGHRVVVYDRDPAVAKAISQKGAKKVASLGDLVKTLKSPKTVWVMVPAGKPTEETIQSLKKLLQKGSIVIDGGNSYYKDSIRHANNLAEKGIHFLDCGTSGGIWGLEVGYCLMVGGEKNAFQKVEPILKTLAPKEGYLHVGKSGAGHFVKMVHNGIEYALMQAYGEGFALLHGGQFDLKLGEVAHLWNQGSVVRSWLLELAEKALSKNPGLSGIKGFVEDSGEGRWTVQEAVESGVAAPAIALSLFSRFRSRQDDAFADKMIAALRNEFGGHAIKRSS